MKLEKFLEFFWKEMLYLKFKIMMKPYFHLYLTFYPDNWITMMQTTMKMTLIFFPGHTNIEPMKYHKENNLYTMSRSELRITVSHQLSVAILLIFISAPVGYFVQGSYLER